MEAVPGAAIEGLTVSIFVMLPGEPGSDGAVCRAAARGLPHLPQNFWLPRKAAPQLAQICVPAGAASAEPEAARRIPHPPQNFFSSETCALQLGQIIWPSRRRGFNQ